MNHHHNFAWLAVFFSLAMGGRTNGQLIRPSDAPTREQAMQILDYGPPTVTHSGNVIFRFPNYDISIQGSPEYAGQGNGRATDSTGRTREQVSTRVIYKSPNGAWDGANFVINPNYNYSYANKFYRNRITHPHHDGPRDDGCSESDVWVPQYRGLSVARGNRGRAVRVENTFKQPASKSAGTLARLYESGPSFVYSPTPNTFSYTSPYSRFNQSTKAVDQNAKQQSSDPKGDKEEKELLWKLDQTRGDWDKRQTESTRKSRRRQRKNARQQRSEIPAEPQRLSEEPQ